MLRILVALGDSEYADDYMVVLLSRGYEVFIVEDHAVLVQLADKYSPQIVIFDMDSRAHGGMENLKALRQRPSMRHSSLILFSKESGLDFVKSTMKLGVIGYLYKPITLEILREQLYKLLDTLEEGAVNRREFVRVKPGPFEKAGVELVIPGGQALSGSILDISLGGVAFRLVRPERIEAIVRGQVYAILLTLEGVGAVRVSATAVLARGDSAAFQFKGLDDEALRSLCRYIHNKLVLTNPENPQEAYMKLV